MFDFSFGELGLIGVVALVVLGPERLPKVARQVGDWVGKAQRYVSQVKNDIQREIELTELKKLQEQAQSAARSIENAARNLETDLGKAGAELENSLAGASTDQGSATPGAYTWQASSDGWQRSTFARRYKPGPSVDELADEITRLKRELALPDSFSAGRRKYAPRARMNRARIRR